MSKLANQMGWISAALLCAAPARAQEVDIEIPVLIVDTRADETSAESDEEIDLASIVQTAAKGVTTVQEAPSIVTVITAEEIRDRSYRNLEDIVDTVPGWMRFGALHSQFPFMLARGTMQASMFMHNSVSLFDSMYNVSSVSRIQPLETIKRVEMITGPGGVLWGANSYLGIINVVTKDADDVDGVEAAVGIGDGNGDRGFMRGYVMAGIPELVSEDVRLFVHTSFETYIGSGTEMPAHVFSQPLPQPNSLLIYGPLTKGEPRRSMLFNLDGKLEVGAVSFYFQVPYTERRSPIGFPGNVIVEEMVEDSFPDCPAVEPFLPNGQPNPDVLEGAGAGEGNDNCLDQGRQSRDNQLNIYDRYVIGEYRTRLADGKAGVTLKGYAMQFVRDFDQLQVLPPIDVLLEGGLAFKTDGTTYRVGASLDGDLELPSSVRLLYGAEAFKDWLPDRTTASRQGPGSETQFFGPYDLSKLPLPCPREPDGAGGTRFVAHCPLTFAFETSRSVLGAFVNPQWRPTKKLILDAGARLQIAPESLGGIGYPLQLITSGALVYNFWPSWHVKLNYAEGFRPPVFNNVVSNGEAVQLDGGDLEVEESQAMQAEINARLFKGERRLRELNFRADYSYTRLENLIALEQGRWTNGGDRGIHSVEFLGKLYLQGGHRFEVGYTWLRTVMEDRGVFRAMPEHFFTVSGVFDVLPDTIEATGAVRVLGAFEDANRLVEHRPLSIDPLTGRSVNSMGEPEQLFVQPHELVLDRIPPSAELMVGMAYTGINKLRLTANAYNVFNARHYQPDGFYDLEPRLEFLPNPYEDFRFTVNATYAY